MEIKLARPSCAKPCHNCELLNGKGVTTNKKIINVR